MASGDIVVRLLGDTKDLEQKFGDLGRTTESFARKLSDGLGSALRGVSAAVTGAATAFGATALITGAKRFADIEDATASLTVTMGDAAKATQFVGEVLKVVEGTPFTLDQFLTAGKNLVNLGQEAAKVPGILTAIGESAAATGRGAEGVDQLTAAFGRISTGSKVMLGDVRAIEELGVPALKILANEAGVSADEMAKRISKGSVDSQEAIDGLVTGIISGTEGINGATRALGGSMEATGHTIRGEFERIQTATARLGAGIIQTFQDSAESGKGLSGVFADISKAIDVLTETIKTSLAKVLGDGAMDRISSWFDKLPSFVKTATDFLKQFKDVLVPLGAAFVALGGEQIAAALGPLGKLIPTLNPIIAALVGIIAVSPQARAAFVELAKEVGSTLSAAFHTLLPVLNQVFVILGSAFSRILASVTPVFTALVAALAAIIGALAPVVAKFAEIVAVIIEGLTPALTPLIGILSEVAQVLLGGIAQALTILAPAIAETAKIIGDSLIIVFRALEPLVVTLAQSIGQILVAAVQLLAPLLPSLARLIQAILLAVVPLIPVITELARQFTDALVKALLLLAPHLPKIIDAFIKIVVAITPLIPILAQLLLAIIPLIGPLVDIAVTILGPVLSALTTFMAKNFELSSKILPPVIAVLRFLVDGIVTLVGWIRSLLSWLGSLGTTFSSVWNTIKDTFRTVVNGIITAWNALDLGIHIHAHLPSWLGGFGFDLDINDIFPDIPYLAQGGIVKGPTLAMLGEAGPEAVVPLSGGFAGGRVVNNYFTINVPPTANKAEIGAAVVDVLKEYERRSGTSWRAAS